MQSDSLGFRVIRDGDWKTAIPEAKKRITGQQATGTGRGIIIIGGGKYAQWTLLNVIRIRDLGWDGPLEVWALNPREIDDKLMGRLTGMRATVRFIDQMLERWPTLRVSGWHSKIYAALHCSYHDVLVLDSDSIPESAGLALFDSPAFQQTGAIFTRDVKRCHQSPLPFHIAGIKAPWERGSHEFETGFMMINRVRHHRALRFVHWLQEHSPYWWRLLHGDKGTTEIGWRSIGADYTLTQQCTWDGWGITHYHDARVISRHMMAAKRGEAKMPADMGRYGALVAV